MKLTKKNGGSRSRKYKKTKKQQGSGIFSRNSKEKQNTFKNSMKHFCEITDSGNNINKKEKVLRKSVNKVCNEFFELEESNGGGIIGGTFNAVTGLLKKPIHYVSTSISSLTQKANTSPENSSNSSIKPLH